MAAELATVPSPGNEPAAVAHALARLRSGGHRITAPRKAVIYALARVQDHPSAEELWAALENQHPRVHRVTVYRTLETLAELGVVTHVHMSHGRTAYHLTSPVDSHEHLHARCRVCGAVFDLPGDLLDPVRHWVAQDSGFELDPRHVALSGTCLSCQGSS